MPEPDPFGPLRGDQALSPRIANYRIAATYDPAQRRISATQTVTWRNTAARPVTRIPFHLYINAFKSADSVFMRESGGHHRRAKANPDAPGWIDVTSIRIAGADVRDRATFPGPDETVLDLPLPAPLASGDTIAIDMAFDVQLPEVFARTGYKGAFAMVGQWFPKPGVLVGPAGEETWHCEPFHFLSEFFADFGTYDVALTIPETHEVAATGVLVSADSHGDGTRTLTYRAEDVHDFAWMIDPYMKVMRGVATVEGDEVEIRVWYRPGQRAFAKRHLAAAIGAVETFSELLVPYPYSMIQIVDPPFDAASGAGGMEYPTIVTTAADMSLTGPGIRLPEFVTIHEVGHNWAQGILASNEVDEAWLDEGVNEYLDGVVLDRLYDGYVIERGEWKVRHRELRGFISKLVVAPITTKSYEFPHDSAYGAASYSKTAMALRSLQNYYGDDRFLRAMKSYAQRYAFRHPTGREFFDALEASLDDDIDWFVQPAFYGAGLLDLRIDRVDCHDKGCRIAVLNAGNVPAPVEVAVEYEDGSEERLDWTDRTFWKSWNLPRGDVARVVIDPDHAMVLDRSPLASEYRRARDRAAARRAGARAQHWTQTLMQVTGL